MVKPMSPVLPVLAQAWLDDALAEHASIAAFSKLSLQLMALGAPPHLLEKCHRAALDEIEHAKTCFRWASRFSPRPLGPGPFPDLQGARIDKTTWAGLAVDSLLDGCLIEGWATEVLVEASLKARDPDLVRSLQAMAADESRHVELSWDIAAWALEAGGPQVEKRLRKTLAALPANPRIETIEGFEPEGRVGSDAQREAFVKVREIVIRRATRLLEQGEITRAPHNG